jgi:hypothetical protein
MADHHCESQLDPLSLLIFSQGRERLEIFAIRPYRQVTIYALSTLEFAEAKKARFCCGFIAARMTWPRMMIENQIFKRKLPGVNRKFESDSGVGGKKSMRMKTIFQRATCLPPGVILCKRRALARICGRSFRSWRPPLPRVATMARVMPSRRHQGEGNQVRSSFCALRCGVLSAEQLRKSSDR